MSMFQMENMTFPNWTAEWPDFLNASNLTRSINYTAYGILQTKWKLVQFVCQSILLLIGVPWNVVVAYVSFSLVRKRQKRFNVPCSCMLMTQIFIFNLSIIDILALIANASANGSEAIMRMLANKSIQCWIPNAVTQWSTIASSIAILCLNFDRFLAITRPLRYVVLVRKTRIYVCIFACWSLATIWVVFYACRTADHMLSENGCLVNSRIKPYYAIYISVFILIPNLIALTLSVCIAYIVIRRKKHQIAHESVSGSTRIRLHSQCPSNNEVKAKNASTTTRMLAFIFVTTIWSCVTNLSYRLYSLIGWWFDDKKEPDPRNVITGHVLLMLVFINPAGNPLLTILTLRTYRIMVASLWTRNRRKSQDDRKSSIFSVQNAFRRTSGV